MVHGTYLPAGKLLWDGEGWAGGLARHNAVMALEAELVGG